MAVALSQFAFAVFLFFLIGWFGRHSTTTGYLSLSLFVKRDEAPAFNVAFRIFAPLVGIVIAATGLYAVGLDSFVVGAWRVAGFYVALRVAHNLAYERARIIDWWREAALAFATIAGAWWLYDRVISVRAYLLPDPASVSTELWVLVAVFVYATLNRLDVGTSRAEKRKEAYVRHAYDSLKSRHGALVATFVPDKLAESLVYTVMVYEGFQRPRLVQAIERALLRKGGTYGPMQVQADVPIADEQSVREGGLRVVGTYLAERSEVEGDYQSIEAYERDRLARAVAREYNPDDDYAKGIAALHGAVIYHFYPELKRSGDKPYPDDEDAEFSW